MISTSVACSCNCSPVPADGTVEYVDPKTFGGVFGPRSTAGASEVACKGAGAITVGPGASDFGVIIVELRTFGEDAGTVEVRDGELFTASLAKASWSPVTSAVGLFVSILVDAPQFVQKRWSPSIGLPHCEQKRGDDCATATLL